MPASAVIANLSFYCGEDKAVEDVIYQADGTTVQNITGWTLSFTVHAYRDDGAVYFTKTTGGGGIVLTDPTAGELTITINRADTVDLPPGTYGYVIARTNSGANAVPTIGLLTLLQR